MRIRPLKMKHVVIGAAIPIALGTLYMFVSAFILFPNLQYVELAFSNVEVGDDREKFENRHTGLYVSQITGLTGGNSSGEYTVDYCSRFLPIFCFKVGYSASDNAIWKEATYE